MPDIYLKASRGDYQRLLPFDTMKHVSYVKGLLDASPEGDAVIDVPNSTQLIIDIMIDFLGAHAADPLVEEGWEKLPPRELTVADKTSFQRVQALNLVDLLKAANFIGSQMLLNAVATHAGTLLVSKNEEEVQDYFGIHRTFTQEEQDMVKAKYPLPFY